MNALRKLAAFALSLAFYVAWASEPPHGMFDQEGAVTVPKTAGGKQWMLFSANSVFKTDPVIGYFMGKREPSLPEHALRYATLQQKMSDTELIAAMGSETAVELTITEVFALLRTQRGEGGALQADGHENIAYVRDKHGVLRTVLMGKDADGWYLNARAVDDSTRHAGDRVFFPTATALPPS